MSRVNSGNEPISYLLSSFSASVVSADKPDNNEDSQANLKQQMLTLEDKENWYESYLTVQCLFDSLRTTYVMLFMDPYNGHLPGDYKNNDQR